MASFTRETNCSFYDESYSETVGGVFIRPHSVQLKASRTGEAIPRFKQLIKDKQPATSPLTAYTQSCKVTKRGSYQVKRKPAYGGSAFTDTYFGLGTTMSGNNFAPGNMVISPDYVKTYVSSSFNWVKSAQADALRNATNKIGAIQNPANLQVFLAESREIKGLLEGPLAKYFKLVFAALLSRKQLLSQAKIQSKDLSSLWLELQFGVIPLIRDISDITKLFTEKADQQLVNRVHAYGVSNNVISDTLGNNSIHQGLVLNNHVVTVGTAEYFIHCGIAAAHQTKAYGLDALTNQLLDVMQLPATAWELIPWSFLIDYFVNIGDIINSTVTARSSVSYTSQTFVQTVSSIGQCSIRSFNSSGSWIESVTPIQPVKEYVSKCRVVTRTGGQLGIPPLVVTLPGSNKRYANIAALAYQSLTHLKS